MELGEYDMERSQSVLSPMKSMKDRSNWGTENYIKDKTSRKFTMERSIADRSNIGGISNVGGLSYVTGRSAKSQASNYHENLDIVIRSRMGSFISGTSRSGMKKNRMGKDASVGNDASIQDDLGNRKSFIVNCER